LIGLPTDEENKTEGAGTEKTEGGGRENEKGTVEEDGEK
jgi:hypothetical protein